MQNFPQVIGLIISFIYLSLKKICTMDLHNQSGKNIYYEILLSEFLIKVGKNIQIILNGGVLQLLL